jgi:glycosyltransferase involved in cell wall biosynthesis
MHILFIPSYFPEQTSPFTGSIFENFTKNLISRDAKLGTVYVEQKSLKKILLNPKRNLYQITKNYEYGILTYRLHALNLFNQHKIGAEIWINLTKKLLDIYIEDNGKPDIIHAQNVFHGGRVALACSRKYKIPYIITEHASGFLLNEYSKENLRICRSVQLNSSYSIAVSTNLAKAIAYSCDVFEPIIVPNSVNTDFFNIKMGESKNNAFTFISVGNLLQNKGHHLLIQAFNQFSINNPNSLLYIFGSGPEYKRLLKLVFNLKLEKKVFLKGQVYPNDLVKFYQRSHCFVLPSIKETFGVVLIEAMACGLPIISTSSGGPEDLIKPFNGVLVEPTNVSQMAQAMQYILNNYDSYKSEEIRGEIVKNFSEDVISNRMMQLYKNVINVKNNAQIS